MGKPADLVGTKFSISVRLDATAIDGDADNAVFYAFEKCKIISAGFVPDTIFSGVDTNSRSLGFVNKGTDGLGATAVKAAVDFVSGVDIAAMDYKELVSEADAKTVNAGEVLSFVSTHVGDGLVQPAGIVTITYAPLNV